MAVEDVYRNPLEIMKSCFLWKKKGVAPFQNKNFTVNILGLTKLIKVNQNP